MDREQPGNTYGNVIADGNTNVQLGDRSVKNCISIQTAYITLQDELELPQPQLLQNSQYTNLLVDGAHGALTVARANRRNHACKRRRDDEGAFESEQVGKAPCRGLSFTQRHSKSNSRPSFLAEQRGSSSSITNGSAQDELLLDQGQSRAVYELLITLATILSCILGRNVSPSDLSDFLRKCQHDQLLPAMTFLLGIGLYRFFSSRRLLQNPSCMSQERITLEDAYGHLRLLSLDICGDFNVFKSFLESHYRETTAPTGEALVKAGQFNLILGSRRGNILHPSKWRKNRLVPGSRIINSVYMKSDDGKCFLCQKSLIVSELGEFHCLSCQTFYRDFDTLREIDTTLSDPISIIEQDDSVPLEMLIEPQSPVSRSLVSDALQYKATGLKNLDIQIVPRITPEGSYDAAKATSDQYSRVTDTQASVQDIGKLSEGDRVGLKLGKLPLDKGLEEDVRADLTELDSERPTFPRALDYVDKVKTRFAHQPEVYKTFLEILQTYQREGTQIKEVVSQIAQLFVSAPDLVDDFKIFMPQSADHSMIQTNSTLPAATTSPQMAQMNMHGETADGTSPDSNTQLRQPDARLQRQRMQAQNMQGQMTQSNDVGQMKDQIDQSRDYPATNTNNHVDYRSDVERRNEAILRHDPSLPIHHLDVQRPAPHTPPELTKGDNLWINRRAAEMAKSTPRGEMSAIVEAMGSSLRQALREKRIDPIIYFFRRKATIEFRRVQGYTYEENGNLI